MKKITIILLAISCFALFLTGCIQDSTVSSSSINPIESDKSVSDSHDADNEDSNKNKELSEELEQKYLSELKDLIFPDPENDEYNYERNARCFFYDIDRDTIPELFLGTYVENGGGNFFVYDFENGTTIKYEGRIADYGDADDIIIRKSGHCKLQQSEFGGLEIYSSEEKIIVKSMCFANTDPYPMRFSRTLYYNISDNVTNNVGDVSYTWLGKNVNPHSYSITTPPNYTKEVTEEEYNEYCNQFTDGLEYEYIPFVDIETLYEADNLKIILEKAYNEYQGRIKQNK